MEQTKFNLAAVARKAVLGLNLVALGVFCDIRYSVSIAGKFPRSKYWSGMKKFFGSSSLLSSIYVFLNNTHSRHTDNEKKKKKRQCRRVALV